ncbi:MAG: hypothetical protein LBG89_01700 [Rickettsiales bacterium]|jgi:hypothetical protein|nr:hypothetical protein [Rickettsiales bacterium]
MTFARIFKGLAIAIAALTLAFSANAATITTGSGRPSIAPTAEAVNRYAISGSLTGMMNTYVVSAQNAASQTNTGGGTTTGGGECRRVQSCLERDSNCGEFFEYCTTTEEFNIKKSGCKEHTAACDAAELTALFGNNSTTPSAGSYIMKLIAAGAEYVAGNSQTRCSRAVNKCFADTCAKNPNLCFPGANSDDEVNTLACKLVSGAACTQTTPRKVLMNGCLDSIGTNKDCRAMSGAKDNDDVFDDMYDRYFTNFRQSVLEDIKAEFDREIRQQCLGDAENCVRSTCGNGNALVCHQQASVNNVFDASKIKSVVGTICDNTMNTNLACSYAAAVSGVNMTSVVADAINVFANKLKNMFDSNTAVQVEKQCMAVVQDCVEDKCGENFYSCMRLDDGTTSSLKVRLNDKSAKSFCWNEVLSDNSCDTYFQIVGAKNSTSALGSWNYATAATANDQANNERAFAQMLRLVENIATSKREAEYSVKMNRCVKVGGNTMWGWGANDSGGVILAQATPPTYPTTMQTTDKCWSLVQVAVTDGGLNSVLKEKGHNVSTTQWWVPAGNSFTCGEQLGSAVYTTLKNFYKPKDFVDDGMLPDWLKTTGAAVLGAGAAGYGGYQLSQALDLTQGSKKSGVVDKIDGYKLSLSAPLDISTMDPILDALDKIIADSDFVNLQGLAKSAKAQVDEFKKSNRGESDAQRAQSARPEKINALNVQLAAFRSAIDTVEIRGATNDVDTKRSTWKTQFADVSAGDIEGKRANMIKSLDEIIKGQTNLIANAEAVKVALNDVPKETSVAVIGAQSAQAAINNLVNALNSMRTTAAKDSKDNKDSLSGGGYATTIGLGLLGGALAGAAVDSAQDSANKKSADKANAELMARFEAAIQCTINLPGGSTKVIGYGEMFVLPNL